MTSSELHGRSLDEGTIKYVCNGLVSGDRHLQREIVDRYITEDVKFIHIMGYARGREAMYGIYRLASTALNYSLIFEEVVIGDGLAAVYVNLNIKLRPFSFPGRYNLPTIVLLRFRRGPDGEVRICEQFDHHSVFTTVWAFGWPLTAVVDNFLLPLTGKFMVTSGWALDLVNQTWEQARDWGWAQLKQLVQGPPAHNNARERLYAE